MTTLIRAATRIRISFRKQHSETIGVLALRQRQSLLGFRLHAPLTTQSKASALASVSRLEPLAARQFSDNSKAKDIRDFTWREVRNHQGRLYYENIQTKERSWDKPEGPTVRIFTITDQTYAEIHADDDYGEAKDKSVAEMNAGEKVWHALVRSSTLYWVAFAGCCGYVGTVFYNA